jgi:hypothetical protein
MRAASSMTDRAQVSFEFEAHRGRKITAAFDAGALTTDGGASHPICGPW